ncbi:hypothetical protein, partial [Thiolapillus sp.]
NKRTMDPRLAQQLVNAQVEVNRTVHAMNMLHDPSFSDDCDVDDVERHATFAVRHLHEVLSPMYQRTGLVQVRAVLPAQKAFMVRRWEQTASAVGEVGNG